MIKIVSILSLGLILQACLGNPIPPTTNPEPKQAPSRFSITEIKKKQEAKYAQLLIELNAKNVAEEVEKAKQNNTQYLLAYSAGRGGAMKAPGLTESQFKQNKCKMVLLDGMGDSIYGENHARFRVAQRQYAIEFNTLMLPYCR